MLINGIHGTDGEQRRHLCQRHSYSDTIRESAQVRVELDQALAELHKARGEQQSLEQEVQRLKSDEDESLQAMNRMRDQASCCCFI